MHIVKNTHEETLRERNKKMSAQEASSGTVSGGGGDMKKKNSQYASLQFYRTALCNDYKKGYCPRGERCTFAHGDRKLCDRPRLTKTKMCPNKGCTKTSCGYAHTRKELVSTGSFWKTEMCRFGSQCKIKSTCRFAHDSTELRYKTNNGEEISHVEQEKMDAQMRAQAQAEDRTWRNNEASKAKGRKLTNLDMKLGKLMDVIDEDKTTLYTSNMSGEEGQAGNCPFFSEESNSYTTSVLSDSDLNNSEQNNSEQMSALDIIWKQMSPSNELWMPAANNPVMREMMQNVPSSPMQAHCHPAPFRLDWWTITEDDLVFAMPDHYED